MIELRTFGQVELTAGEGGDADTLVANSKRFALFCYLAFPNPGALHRRDTLLGVFWPDVDQAHARMNLRQALAVLRRSLGNDVLIRCGDEEVGLSPDLVWCDAAEFQRAVDARKWADAVGLYRGEFLQGLFLSRDREFERWLGAERSRLARGYAGALEEAGHQAAAAGEVRVALEYCERLVEHDPYNSRSAIMLLRAFTASGDPANALLYAERHTALLRAELDVKPPAEFDAEVERIRALSGVDNGVEHKTAQSLQNLGATDGVEAPIGGPQQARRIPARATVSARLAATLVLLVVVIGGALAMWSSNPGSDESGRLRPTVGVMPLQPLGSPADSAFAAGLTGAITSRLAGISKIGVVATNGLRQPSANDQSYSRIAEDLGVGYLLTGTVQRERQFDPESSVLVNVQLVRARDGVVAWSDGFSADPVEIFALYSEIGAQVANALNVTLLEPERRALAEPPTENAQAYQYYLMGNAYFEQGYPIRWELRNAVEMYGQAIAADTQFALAYARLSMAHGGLYWGGHDRSEERLAKGKWAADEALRLHPGLPEGHLALGLHHYRASQDYERTLDELELAKEGLADDFWYLYSKAPVNRRMGNFTEAAQGFAAASDLRPLAWSPALEAGQTYRVLREFDDARRYLDRYAAIQPSWAYGYLRKALTYLEESGDVERAREVLNTGPEHLPYDALIAAAARDFCMPGWFRLLRVLCGDCRQAIERMEIGAGREHWHYYLGKGLLHDRLGDNLLKRIYYDSAVVILEGMVEQNLDGAHYHSDLGLAYAALGRRDEAVREVRTTVSIVEAAETRDFWGDYGPYRKLAEVYATFGEADSATAQLEYLLSELVAGEESGRHIGAMASVPLMRIDPVWDPIRDHPRFRALLEQYEYLWHE